MDPLLCPTCAAQLPDGFEKCRAVFEDVCAREYSDPGFGAVHLMTVDAFCLQHCEECGPRSNAFHLLRLCTLLERGGDPHIGQRPPRAVGKALEKTIRDFPALQPPAERGRRTVVEVHGVEDPTEHALRRPCY